MGLLRTHHALDKKKHVVKDKFHLKKKSDTAFLQARNDRCALAADLLPGAFVFLDSPKLGTTMALSEAGVDPARMFPVNGCDKAGFCKKAEKMGARPTVCMFDAAPQLLEDWGVKNVQLCYNDGTHGDPDLVWADMLPWILRLPPRAYLSFTFSLRSHNAVPLTGKFGLVIMLALRGFEPPGGWQFLSSAFTFDGRIFNIQMTRGVAGKVCEKSGLCQDNGYSFGTRYENSESPNTETLEDVRGFVRRFLKKCPSKPSPMNSQTRHVPEWESLRRRICQLGVRGEKSILEDLRPTDWVAVDYLHWVSNKNAPLSRHYAIRYPKRLLSSETRHWTMVGAWVCAGLQKFSNPTALVVAEMHPKSSKYREWLRQVLPLDILRRTLCVGDPYVTAAVKASGTRGTSHPFRITETLSELLCKQDAGDALFRFGRTYSMIFLPLLSSTGYHAIKEKVEEAMIIAGEQSLLFLSIRSTSPLSTVAWVVWLVSHLAENFKYKMANFCEMDQDGGDLVDYSRIVTVVLSRGI